jgi:hypothetical protein
MTWYSGFPYRIPFVINGLCISGNHIDFPFRFRVTGNSHISSNAHSGGKDFIFTLGDGITRVNCEVDGYLYGSGSVWVKAPRLYNNATSTFYLYYGDGTNHTTDVGFKPSGVWEPSYQAVYHMSDFGTNVVDSTFHGYDGTGSTALDYRQPGNIDKNIGFQASAYQSITINGDNFNFRDLTIEAIIQTKSTAGSLLNARIVAISGTTYRAIMTLQRDDLSSPWYAVMANTQADHSTAMYSSAGQYINDNNWHYLVGTTQPEKIFVDGKINTQVKGDSWSVEKPGTRIGSKGNNFWFSGAIDEVRISNKIRSNGWIKTSYSSMNYPSNFIRLGRYESSGGNNYEWFNSFPYLMSSINWCKVGPLIFFGTTIPGQEEGPATTGYYTIVGGPTGWKWKQIEVSDVIITGSPGRWVWNTTAGLNPSNSPSGTTLSWKWNT